MSIWQNDALGQNSLIDYVLSQYNEGVISTC